MDLLRAAIIGPKGTPYHDGLFFFDVHIPSAYPSGPPVYIPKSFGMLLFLFIYLLKLFYPSLESFLLYMMGVTVGILPLWRTSD
jgi:hypothetical protein